MLLLRPTESAEAMKKLIQEEAEIAVKQIQNVLVVL